jgi:integral membrane protein (TIGR00529 family)
MVFALPVIVIGINRKLHLGLTMFAGGLILLVAAGVPPAGIAEAAYLTIRDRAAQVLLLSIILIEILGNLLKKAGWLQKMILHLGRLFTDLRLLTAVLPALIGILAVPGGAIIAAPLVEEVGRKAGLSPARQASVNIWFRHAFYFAFPLFPSAILAAELAGINVILITKYNLSLSISGLAIAFLIIFKGIPGGSGAMETAAGTARLSGGLPRRLAALSFSVAPLALVLILAAGFKLFFPLTLAAGIGAAFFGVLPAGKGFVTALKRRFVDMVLPGIKFKLALVVLGIMFFKQSLEYSGATVCLSTVLLKSGIPLLVIMFLFPALIGFITGENAAAVAIVFPLFLPLLSPGSPIYPAQVAFLYFSSAMGHIFTPTHPCLSLTNEYFNVKFNHVVSPLLIPAAAVVVLALLQLVILGLIFPAV